MKVPNLLSETQPHKNNTIWVIGLPKSIPGVGIMFVRGYYLATNSQFWVNFFDPKSIVPAEFSSGSAAQRAPVPDGNGLMASEDANTGRNSAEMS